jgi:hypothetical protein
MTNGLPTSGFISFHDAAQFLAGGGALSLHPTWLNQEELDQVPLVEQCKREIEAAADEDGSYPLAPSDLDGSPASIIAALDQHRPYWTRSCAALYDGEVAAGVARVNKEARLWDAERRLIETLRAGDLAFHGVSIGGDPQFQQIHPGVGTMYSDVEEGEIEVHDGIMFTHPTGLPDRAPRPLFRAVVVERRALIDWAGRSGRSGTATNADLDEVPSAGEAMVPALPEEAPTPQQTNADTQQVPANAEPPIKADSAGRGLTETAETTWVTGRTGLPGRPTPKDFILAEARRRLERGDFPRTLAAFCRELAEWYSNTPEAKEGRLPAIEAVSLENSVRPLWHSRDKSKARKTSP